MNNRDIALPRYKRLRWMRFLSIIASTLSLGVILFIGSSHFFAKTDPSFGEWWAIGLLELLFVSGVILFVYSNNAMIHVETQMRAVGDFFSKPVYISPQNVFVRSVEKFSRIKRNYHQGVFIAINIKDLHGDILNFYGSDEVKAINTIILEAIVAIFSDDKVYRFGFSYLDSFLLFKKTNDPEKFYSELDPFIAEVDRRIAERARIPSITMLFGSYVINKKDNLNEAVDKAVYASRYNDNTRFSNTVVPFSQDQIDVDASEKSLPFEIMKGMKENQFQIYYQPKFNLHTKRFYGAEALVRWTHPTRGLLPPSFFVPLSI